MGISVEIRRVVLISTVSITNWNLKLLVFVEGGKLEYENQQQTQPMYDAGLEI